MKVKNKNWYSFLNLVLHVTGVMLAEYSDWSHKFEIYLKFFWKFSRFMGKDFSDVKSYVASLLRTRGCQYKQRFDSSVWLYNISG